MRWFLLMCLSLIFGVNLWGSILVPNMKPWKSSWIFAWTSSSKNHQKQFSTVSGISIKNMMMKAKSEERSYEMSMKSGENSRNQNKYESMTTNLKNFLQFKSLLSADIDKAKLGSLMMTLQSSGKNLSTVKLKVISSLNKKQTSTSQLKIYHSFQKMLGHR